MSDDLEAAFATPPSLVIENFNVSHMTVLGEYKRISDLKTRPAERALVGQNIIVDVKYIISHNVYRRRRQWNNRAKRPTQKQKITSFKVHVESMLQYLKNHPLLTVRQ